MKKTFVVAAGVLASFACSAAQPLFDFSSSAIHYDVGQGRYDVGYAGEQLSIGGDGLTVRCDAAKEASLGGWVTICIPASAGAAIDWKDRLIVLVMADKPSGRMMSNVALNFTDDEGETMQFAGKRTYYNDDGDFCIEFDLALNHGKGWGGQRQNGEVDGKFRFSAINVHFHSGITAESPVADRTGEATFLRIDEVPREVVSSNVPRTVVSREAISTDTMYPGAAPFPGAKSLVFKVEPRFSGKATVKLSHGSTGAVGAGIIENFTADVTNGIARFALDLPYETEYQYMSLDCKPADGTKGPFKVVKAAGEFVQTAAEAMRLVAETGNPLHLVRDGKGELPHLLVTNPSKRDISWKTVFVLSDYFGRKVEIPFNWKVGAGETARVSIPMPLPAKGLWRVRAVVAGDDASLAVKETRFGYLDLHEVTPKVEKPKFRLGIHYHGTMYWPDKIDQTISALVAAGAKFTRCDYSHMWSDICPTQEVFDRGVENWNWLRADTMVDKLAKAGLAMDIIFAGFPGWAATPGCSEKMEQARKNGFRVRNCCLLPREGLFRDFCKIYAARYGTKIDYYECGNEWDLTGTEAVECEDLLRLQREAYEGLHAGNPNVCVIPNGWTTSATPVNPNPKVWRVGLVEHFAQHPETYDAWALHNHGDFGSFQVGIDNRFLPLYNSTPLKSRPWLLNETARTSHQGNEDLVARLVWMKILFGWSRGARDYIWYNLRATGWFDGGEPGYGLITCDYRPRAGYAAFSALSTIFQGLDFDATYHSAKQRHLFRFRGKSQAVDGLVVVGWDSQGVSATRAIRIRTDAKRARLADLMGNLTPVELHGGEAIISLCRDPQALLLDGATTAEVVNREMLESDVTTSVLLRRTGNDVRPLFSLSGSGCVRNIYEANPAMVDHLWKGNSDLSAKVWLKPVKNGIEFRVLARDDIRGEKDELEFVVTEGNGAAKSYTFKPTARTGTRDTYQGVLPVKAKTFGLNVLVHDDDGEGHDGWVFLRGPGEDQMMVTVE